MATDGFLFRNFSSPQEFESSRKNASDQGLTVYENIGSQMFFVIKEGKQIVADYIRNLRDRET